MLRYFRTETGEPSFVSFTAWITLLGVAIGVMSLIIVMSVMNGFESELRRNMIEAESHIILYRKQGGIGKWQRMKSQIEAVDPSIQKVSPILYQEALFLSPTAPTRLARLEGGVIEGNSFHQGRSCSIGKELALKLGVKKGESLRVLIPDPKGGRHTIFPLQITDIFESGLYEYSSRYVYASLSYLQKELGWGDRVTAFKIGIDDPFRATEISRKIRDAVSFPFFVRTWMTFNKNIFLAIEIEKVVMFIILSGIILVAIFNVVSSLVMIVIEKTKEISILRAMGMTSQGISKIFLWQGALMSVAGTILGVCFAFLGCYLLSRFRFVELSPEIYFLSYLPVQIRPLEVVVIAMGMILVSLLASFAPARRAARLFPVEGIRYE